jgi:large subunit ribosomal protein L9
MATQGFKVEKSQIRVQDGHIKQLGDHPVTVALHADVVANITVSVLGE